MDEQRRLSLLDLAAIAHEVAKLIRKYRATLEAAGIDPAEAWALGQRLEERLLGPLFDDAEEAPALAGVTCAGCSRADRVIDLPGADSDGWHLCLHPDCWHHWRSDP